MCTSRASVIQRSRRRWGQRGVSLVDPGAGTPEKQQHEEDRSFRWRSDTNAAELAYILYQVPVLMGVHAAEMLKKDD